MLYNEVFFMKIVHNFDCPKTDLHMRGCSYIYPMGYYISFVQKLCRYESTPSQN